MDFLTSTFKPQLSALFFSVFKLPIAGFLCALLITASTAIAQSSSSDALILVKEEMKFAPHPTYSISDGLKYNDPSASSHPDFGKMTFSVPHDKRVVEVLSERTEFQRHYIDLDDPLFFYIEKGATPINKYDDGFWRAIDPSLHEKEHGLFESGFQEFPTALNTIDQWAEMRLNNDWIRFVNFELKRIENDGSINYVEADWTNASIGNFGGYITDIFPSIDMMLMFEEGEIKSSFIVKENLNVQELTFIDHLDLSDNLACLLDDGDTVGQEFLQVYNTADGALKGIFEPAITFESSGNLASWLNDYSLDGNDLHINVDSVILNGSETVYPVIVDPTFVAVGPISATGGLMGSLPSPASCQTTMNVTFPGGSTPYDVQASWNVATNFCWWWWFNFGFIVDCWMSEAQVWLGTDCGGISPTGAPGTIWQCIGCNAFGVWNPTLPFGVDPSSMDLAQCYAPSCADQTMVFDFNLNRSACNTYLTFDDCGYANSACVYLEDWTIWVQGRSVETLGDNADGSGDATYYDPDCAGTLVLDPDELYGVGPYTYSWSTGESTGTITVPATSSVYTCTVTDACGTAVVATFTIGCPLDNKELQFSVQTSDEIVDLNWTDPSASEVAYYEIERSGNDGQFSKIASMDVHNSATYQWWDQQPFIGNNFYRIKIVKQNGSHEYSSIEKVEIVQKTEELLLIPNPSNGHFSINFEQDTDKPFLIVIRDVQGRVVHQELSKNHSELYLPELVDGVYQVEAYQNEILVSQQRLVLSK